MRVKNHRLIDADGQPCRYEASPNRSGVIAPDCLVMHFTAGSSAESSVQHFLRKEAQASAHLVIGRDGAITQMVPFNRKAWHAGRSRWHQRTGLNGYSIGIELDNAGRLSGGPGRWRSWFGRIYADEDVLVATHRLDSDPAGWHRYTEAQLDAAVRVGQALVAAYGLKEVLGHDDIAPDRKRDAGPAFPMREYRAALLGRGDAEEEEFLTRAALNLRTGPGTDHEKLPESPLARGTRLRLKQRAGVWCDVEVLDAGGEPVATGWVHGHYIAQVG